MNRTERLLLLAWFFVVLVVVITQVSQVFGVLGTAAGVFLGLPIARTAALRGKERTKDVVVAGGVRLQRVGTTIGAHLGVLLVPIVLQALVPGLKYRFVALVCALVTAGAATVVAERLRRES
ncbi:MAG: hypothetical protein JWO60_3317 [Frankiales bacterium]|nr:hypothetical protein [Frankiales bacterium]